uniref:Uncharacterized protein n=1 Tax=Parascaris equorum TaxID=6256 RepID=A0A914R1G7_PAREQ
MEFLSIFNGYFNDADERNIRAGSEPYLGGSSEDFFDDGVPQEDDDDLDNVCFTEFLETIKRVCYWLGGSR